MYGYNYGRVYFYANAIDIFISIQRSKWEQEIKWSIDIYEVTYDEEYNENNKNVYKQEAQYISSESAITFIICDLDTILKNDHEYKIDVKVWNEDDNYNIGKYFTPSNLAYNLLGMFGYILSQDVSISRNMPRKSVEPYDVYHDDSFLFPSTLITDIYLKTPNGEISQSYDEGIDFNTFMEDMQYRIKQLYKSRESYLYDEYANRIKLSVNYNIVIEKPQVTE